MNSIGIYHQLYGDKGSSIRVGRENQMVCGWNTHGHAGTSGSHCSTRIASHSSSQSSRDDSMDDLHLELRKYAELKHVGRSQAEKKHLDLLWSVSTLGGRSSTNQCKSCSGSGEIECGWCHGTGALTVGEMLFCDFEDGCKVCVVCGGKGHLVCQTCRGSGHVASWMVQS